MKKPNHIETRQLVTITQLDESNPGKSMLPELYLIYELEQLLYKLILKPTGQSGPGYFSREGGGRGGEDPIFLCILEVVGGTLLNRLEVQTF